MKKILSIADAVFTIAGLVALVIARFDPSQRLFWPGLIFAIVGIFGAFLLRRASKERRKERVLEIGREDWTVEVEGGLPVRSRLVVPEARHGKGSDINVRVEQTEFKRYDLEEPQLEAGTITIRFRSNNFPMDPRIPLRLHVSSRG